MLDYILSLFGSKINGFTFAVGFLNLEATSFEAYYLVPHYVPFNDCLLNARIEFNQLGSSGT